MPKTTSMSNDSMTAIVDQAKSCYTITDKSTGEVLGYAFMQVEDLVTMDQLQLLPYQISDLGYGQISDQEDDQISLNKDRDNKKTEFRGSLESDLDLSEDSSMNATVEDEIYSQPCASKNVTDLMNVSQSQADLENDAIQSRLDEISFGIESASVSSPASNSYQEVLSSPVKAKSVTQTVQQASEMRNQRLEDEQEDSDQLATRKRKEDSEEQPSKRANQWKGLPKYQALYTEEGVKQRENVVPKNRRVRCLLCTDGRTLVVGNFGMHVKALHLPDVKCEDCGQDVKPSRVIHHKKTCVGKKRSSLVSRSNEVMVSDTSFVSCASSLVDGPDNVNNSDLLKDLAAKSVDDNNYILYKEIETQRPEVDMITFVLTSAVKESVKVKVMTVTRNKMKKVMKKFGQKLNVEIAGLRFMLGGVELSGEEIVGKLEGRDILVWGDLKK